MPSIPWIRTDDWEEEEAEKLVDSSADNTLFTSSPLHHVQSPRALSEEPLQVIHVESPRLRQQARTFGDEEVETEQLLPGGSSSISPVAKQPKTTFLPPTSPHFFNTFSRRLRRPQRRRRGFFSHKVQRIYRKFTRGVTLLLSFIVLATLFAISSVSFQFPSTSPFWSTTPSVPSSTQDGPAFFYNASATYACPYKLPSFDIPFYFYKDEEKDTPSNPGPRIPPLDHDSAEEVSSKYINGIVVSPHWETYSLAIQSRQPFFQRYVLPLMERNHTEIPFKIYEHGSGMAWNTLMIFELMEHHYKIHHRDGGSRHLEREFVPLKVLQKNDRQKYLVNAQDDDAWTIVLATEFWIKYRTGPLWVEPRNLCWADDEELWFVPNNSMELVIEAFWAPLYDPLHFGLGFQENFLRLNQLCVRGELVQDAPTLRQLRLARKRQEDHYGHRVADLFRVLRPGGHIVIMDVDVDYCDNPRGWGGVHPDFWRTRGVTRYDWPVEPSATVVFPKASGTRYHVLLEKKSATV